MSVDSFERIVKSMYLRRTVSIKSQKWLYSIAKYTKRAVSLWQESWN